MSKGLNRQELYAFFCVCLTLFIIFLAPSVTSNDAGELGAAAFELGIAHPPGFPVFTIFLNGLIQTLAFGEIGFRGNLGSGLWSALTLSMIFFTVRTRGVKRTEAWCCGLLTACSPLFTVHAVTIEVYASTGFIIALAVEVCLRYLERGDIRYLMTLAVILGIGGLGHHPLLRLVGVCFAFFVLPHSGIRKGVIAFFVSLGSGMLASLYLPIRSSTLPNRDWGAPRTLETLIDHIMGQRIRDSYSDSMGHWDTGAVADFGMQLLESCPTLLVLGCAGLMAFKSALFIRIYAAIFSLDLAYSILINPMGIRDYQNGWLATLALGVLASASIGFVRRQYRSMDLQIRVLLCALVLWQAIQYVSHEEFSQRNPWHEAITKLAQQLQPESLVFTVSDSASSMFAFIQVSQGDRPDLAVVVRQHVFRDSSTGPTFRRVKHALEGWLPGAQLTDLIHLHNQWPLVWEWGDGMDSNVKPALPNLVFPFLGRGQIARGDDLKRWQTASPDALWSQRPNFVKSMVLMQVVTAASTQTPGSIYLANVLKWWPESHFLWMRYAAQLTHERQFIVAEEILRTALTLFPNDHPLMEQSMRVLIAQSRFKEAMDVGFNLESQNSSIQANVLGLLGICSANLRAYVEANKYFDRALAIDPEQHEARVTQPKIKHLLNR
jgi:hypothetical protein